MRGRIDGVAEMSEYKFVLFLIIALFFLFLHRMTVKTKGFEPQYHDGVGRIERVVHDDSGYPWYYVNININGDPCTAKSDTYRSVPEDAGAGDPVRVRYYYTKNDRLRCIITEPGYERFIQEDQPGKPVLLYISIACFGLFLLLLIQKILFG